MLLTPSNDPCRAPEKQTVGTVTASQKMLSLQALSVPQNGRVHLLIMEDRQAAKERFKRCLTGCPRGGASLKKWNNPDPPILAFFDFLAFFRFPIFLAFSCVFPSFSKDFRASAKRETLAFFWGKNPCFFQKKQGLEGQGSCRPLGAAHRSTHQEGSSRGAPDGVASLETFRVKSRPHRGCPP